VLNEKEEKKGKFSLGNLFNGGGGNDESGTTTALRGGKLEPHPSVRSHISALNRLGPDPQVEHFQMDFHTLFCQTKVHRDGSRHIYKFFLVQLMNSNRNKELLILQNM
jgi:hypothetical protein